MNDSILVFCFVLSLFFSKEEIIEKREFLGNDAREGATSRGKWSKKKKAAKGKKIATIKTTFGEESKK